MIILRRFGTVSRSQNNLGGWCASRCCCCCCWWWWCWRWRRLRRRPEEPWKHHISMCVFVYFVLNKHRIINLHIYTHVWGGRLCNSSSVKGDTPSKQQHQRKRPECIIKVENAYKYKCIKRHMVHLRGRGSSACKSATHSTNNGVFSGKRASESERTVCLFAEF